MTMPMETKNASIKQLMEGGWLKELQPKAFPARATARRGESRIGLNAIL